MCLMYVRVQCAAGKIHISEATKAALDSSTDAAFEVELRGETDVKVRQVITDVRSGTDLTSQRALFLFG